MQGILIMRKKNILPHCDNVTGALKEQRGGSSKCLCGFQLPPKIWEEENKIFPQDLLQCMYILSFTYCNFMYLCPSFSLISSFPTNGSGNAKHFDTKCDKRILSKYSIKEKKERNSTNIRQNSQVYVQWVFVSLKKFFRNSRCAVGLCNIIVNCQVKIAEVLLSSAVQCTYYYLLACFYFCSSKFKFKETHSIYIRTVSF